MTIDEALLKGRRFSLNQNQSHGVYTNSKMAIRLD